ncbi:glycine cleavage system protein GcvH [Dysgonomonas capnocytophagoides]|uniref:Glycine cleavage system H protein n=1 Tax=Dysgonomonas capnocytophagoides TaxID=45254 RepID=A0A4Y8KWS8_9BACT|nr:glycine cleavage system protein GcvH [Dysgonomonas capnocytophagoides]TFD93101.1 glycine cleavage system protein GcvH [Dysgonomonas capnocytophagoides]
MAKVVEGLLYTKSHEWVKIEGEFAFIGLTEVGQHELGNIVYIDLPEVGEEVSLGNEYGAVESSKATSDLLSPVSGKVVEVNDSLSDTPDKLNRNPFDSWIIKVKLSDKSQLDKLLDSKAYKELIEK